MKFTDTYNIDLEIKGALKANCNFGNFNISTERMSCFAFEMLNASLGQTLDSLDFYLQKVIYNSATDELEYEDYLQLNNTYRKTGYFEGYEFAAEIDEGTYRLRAGDYYSVELITAIDLYESIDLNQYLADYDNTIIADYDDYQIITL